MAQHPDPRALVVVPCFNEAERLNEPGFLWLTTHGMVRLLCVNDGSTDETGTALAQLAHKSEAIAVMNLSANVGKAEAVRGGLLRALSEDPPIVGYYDADLATPPDQLLRLISALEDDPGLVAVLGSRVLRLGSDIERSALRHYAGRLYATLASAALGLRVYDTQCGAKVFRNTPALVEALRTPFPSRWAFDVWLIHRLVTGSGAAPPVGEDAFLEIPLERWRDIRGSKLSLWDGIMAFLEITRLRSKRLRRQRERRRSGLGRH